MLFRSGLRPSLLRLEIPEASLSRNRDETLAVLRNLAGLGVGLTLDDFGTGSTNLVSLAGLPVDQLKIDRSCSVGLEAEGAAYDTMSELFDASKRLHLPACAAGIETSTQEMVLKQLGCVYGQGYLYFAPLDPDEVAGVVATQPFRGADQP